MANMLKPLALNSISAIDEEKAEECINFLKSIINEVEGE